MSAVMLYYPFMAVHKAILLRTVILLIFCMLMYVRTIALTISRFTSKAVQSTAATATAEAAVYK